MTVLSLFQTLGAAAGVVSFIYLTLDRWWSRRPFAVLVGHAKMDGMPKYLFIQVHNPTPFPLIFSTTSAGGEFSIMRDDTIDASVRYAIGGRTSFAVPGQDMRRLPMAGPAERFELAPDTPFSVAIEWRRAQAPRLPWTHGVLKVTTTKLDAADLLKDSHVFLDESE